MATSLRLPVETRRRLTEYDRRWPFEFGVRTVSTLSAFIATILFAVTISLSNKSYGGNDWTDSIPLASILLVFVYNPLVVFFSLSYRQGRPIDPGWHVSIDLLIWILAIPSIVFSVRHGWFWNWQPVLFEFDGLIPCDSRNFWSYQCNPFIYALGKMEIAANVFLTIIMILHIILFVCACLTTHKLRKAKGDAATQSRNTELQYHRSPTEHTKQQPPAYTPPAIVSRSKVIQDLTPIDLGNTAGLIERENPCKDPQIFALK